MITATYVFLRATAPQRKCIVSPLQLLWLRTRGGRTIEDVVIDPFGARFTPQGLFVEMINYHGGRRMIPIPEDKDIDMYMNKKGTIRSNENYDETSI